ncbi:class I SAM-dependent methyltransferase [Psychrosphaera algicola]|uniref:Methyltransferase domain-containing protein n=1 Tax=Psychrosphaera algicola TaxID=3023714 RepID=A0ABT5F8B0_9GAMM|nr:methyltransferase domain-containing protein [Psychrosphaera sp. G1-22]MDC2887775.1 methyltransferase domain-containing protein [Psychrosphaera sp. G1-22]
MKPALGYRWIQPVEHWQEFPNGELLKQQENTSISHRLNLCFGNHLLKIGSLASAIDTTTCRINHQISLANLASRTESTGVVGEIDELPFVQHAIDTAVVSHVLEFSADPHQTLREVHRVLMPNGNLILTVFNPLSLLLVGKLWPFKSNKSFWHCRLFQFHG